MTCEFTTRLVQQTLERDALLGEAALQRPSAQMQFSCEIRIRGQRRRVLEPSTTKTTNSDGCRVRGSC
jgi:hypothetical protein